jgi:hypothetical protein
MKPRMVKITQLVSEARGHGVQGTTEPISAKVSGEDLPHREPMKQRERQQL